MQLDVLKEDARTEIGSYFISNYPPFSVWSPEHLPAAARALDEAVPDDTSPLGLYMHIPFCRKRCTFCYFRVYTDKNARDVDTYIDALAKEVALYAQRDGLRNRHFEFVYFGGGTPSFLSSAQLTRLIDRIAEHWSWDRAREVTFECEPGTLQKHKLETIKKIGVTRLSLGIEHFDDDILELNGRAHKSPEVYRAYEWAREVGFDQINVDLIAGMVGDSESSWKETVEKTLALDPDSVTVYQMEVPHNTVIARASKDGGGPVPVADWRTKRAWVDHAFDVFQREGYVVSSAYTVVKPSASGGFVYRDALWQGSDLIGTGVASFSHFRGVHYQNEDSWEAYIDRIGRGELPLARAFVMSDRQRLIRELILQLKTGSVEVAYFRDKFGVDIGEVFAEAIAVLDSDGFARLEGGRLSLTRTGLLVADGLLPRFFEPEFRDIRYT